MDQVKEWTVIRSKDNDDMCKGQISGVVVVLAVGVVGADSHVKKAIVACDAYRYQPRRAAVIG